MNISEVRIIIHKPIGSNTPCHHRFYFVSWYKTSSWYHKFIGADSLITFCFRFDFILSGDLPVFLMPRTTVGLSVKKTRQLVGYTLERSLGMSPDLAISLSLENMRCLSLS